MRPYAFIPAILCLFLLFILAGCGGGGGGGGGGSHSQVHLQFTQAGSLARTAAVHATLTSASPVDFDEGALKTTKTYLFILKNTGTVAATNVALSSDNPAVHVSPSTIGILQPEGAGGVQPVIQVTVEHGTSATGAGYAPTLPGGWLAFNISATSAEVTASASVGVDVQVASVTASFLGVPTDLQTDQLGSSDLIVTANGTFTTARYAGYYTGASSTHLGGMGQLTNTGNVPVSITTYSRPIYPGSSLFSSTGTVTVNPGETLSVNGFAYFPGATPGVDDSLMLTFGVDSGGVEFDSSAMPHADISGTWWGEFTAQPSPAG